MTNIATPAPNGADTVPAPSPTPAAQQLIYEALAEIYKRLDALGQRVEAAS